MRNQKQGKKEYACFACYLVPFLLTLCMCIPIWDGGKIQGRGSLEMLLVEKITGLVNANKDLPMLFQHLQ